MGADPLSLGLMAGSTALNYFGQQDAQKSQKKQLGQQMQMWNQGRADVNRLYGLGIGTYDEALNKVKGIGGVAKSNIRAAGAQNNAAATDSAISRGLYGTSYLDTLKRGVASDTSRNLAGVDEQSAALMTQILQGKAGMYAGQAGTIASMTGGQSNAIGGWQYQNNPVDLSGWAKLFSGQNSGGGGGGQQYGAGFIGPTADGWGY